MKKILYTKFFDTEINEKVDVILSPEFYWIKKIDIPIKSLKDAKKLSKTLFKLEGDFIYDAIEVDGKYFAVAIDKNLKIDIPQRYINSIRLGQSELYGFDCIKIDENHYIQKIDDMLFCFPTPAKNCTKLQKALDIITLSNQKINLNRLNVDKSIIVFSVLIFILINAGLILNIISTKKEIQKIQNNTQNFLQKHNLPPTTFQLNSILENLRNKLKKSDFIKRKLEIISRVPLKKGEYFKKLSFDGKSFYVEVITSRNLDSFFKRYFKVDSTFEKNIYKARLYE